MNPFSVGSSSNNDVFQEGRQDDSEVDSSVTLIEIWFAHIGQQKTYDKVISPNTGQGSNLGHPHFFEAKSMSVPISCGMKVCTFLIMNYVIQKLYHSLLL